VHTAKTKTQAEKNEDILSVFIRLLSLFKGLVIYSLLFGALSITINRPHFT